MWDPKTGMYISETETRNHMMKMETVMKINDRLLVRKPDPVFVRNPQIVRPNFWIREFDNRLFDED